MAGGFTTTRQWPVRGDQPFALQRIDWSGEVPFEVLEINIRKEGFVVHFTKPIDAAVAEDSANYTLSTYTHHYAAGYGSPEVDHTTPKVTRAVAAKDGRSVLLTLEGMVEGHIHDFDFGPIKSSQGEALLHTKAYYTVNEIPKD